MIEEVRFALDSLLEGDGFDPSVPREDCQRPVMRGQVRRRLAAGGRRIRTLSPTLMTRNSDRLIEFDGAGSPIGRSPFRPILVER